MQFMMMVKMRENQGEPTPELMEAMGGYITAALQAGTVVSMGGLLPSAHGAEVHGSNGKIVTSHGPFAETTELIGGYAVLEFESLDEAIAEGEKFVQLHLDNWPGWEGTSEIRPIMAGPS